MFYLSQAEHYSLGGNHLNNSEELLWFSFFLFGPAAWHEEGGEGGGSLVLKPGDLAYEPGSFRLRQSTRMWG